jgi:hypothetical protein
VLRPPRAGGVEIDGLSTAGARVTQLGDEATAPAFALRIEPAPAG